MKYIIRSFVPMLLAGLLFGCGISGFQKKAQEALPKEECRLCVHNVCQEENSLSLLLINTGRIIPIILSKQNEDGTNKQPGAFENFSLETVKGNSDGSRIINMTSLETGKAHITVELDSGSVLDKTKPLGYYCKDCIEKVLASRLDTALFDCREKKVYTIGEDRSFVIRKYHVTDKKDKSKITIDILLDRPEDR